MQIQAFVDDSGGKGHSRHFVLAGLVATAGSWVAFSSEWKACLAAQPAIPLFKMSEAASRSKAFGGFSSQARDDKLRSLARVINRHASFVVSSVIEMDAAKISPTSHLKPFRDPYFWPFHTLITGICFDLWDLGVREKFEIVFDEQLIFGPRARRWYPFWKEMMRVKYPEESAIFPEDVFFRTDHDMVPLQAADLFAWCIRRNTDNPIEKAFEWLLDEMPNVKWSEYSYLMDEERFRVLNAMTRDLLRDGEMPPHLTALWREIQEN